MPLTSILLEYSPDPISDITPTFTTVSNSEFMSIRYWNGPGEEGGEPEPGGAEIRLVNKNRKWEPLFGSNLIDTHQQFRLTLNGSQRGLWFITNIQVEYPAGTKYSEVVFTCSDGMEVLAWDNLPAFDPPEAETYDDVVSFDEPWGFWRLADPEGTQAVAVIKRRFVGKGKHRRRIKRKAGSRQVTRSEAEGVAGPAGSYQNLPLLGQPGAIVGDRDTSVLLDNRSTENQHVRIVIEDVKAVGDGGSATGCKELTDQNKLTVECWAGPAAHALAVQTVVAGPGLSGGAAPVFKLYADASEQWSSQLLFTSGSPSVVTSGVGFDIGFSHVVATWDGNTHCLYVNGVLVDSEQPAGSRKLIGAGNLTGDRPWIKVGATTETGGADESFYGHMNKVAVYEHALTAERVAHHYAAGVDRGWPEQTAGERIADIVDNPRWSTAAVQTAGLMVQPEFQFGQGRLEVIGEIAHSEGPRTMFFFNRAGNPVYLGRDWDSTGAYNTVQATFGEKTLGETPFYMASPPRFFNETFNTVTATHEAGEAVTVTDAAAEGKRGRRENTEFTDLLLMEHADVETIANQVLRRLKDPDNILEEISVDSTDALTQQLALDVGHRVRVRWSGETGARNDRVANILRYEETLDARDRVLRTTYTLSRGFDASTGLWHAGVPGFSEAGVTTVAG